MTYPNQIATGQNNIDKSCFFSGAQYVNLGQPSALTSVLNATHEFTVLVRTCRVTGGSIGVIFGKSDSTHSDFSIYSNGGNYITGNIGGNTFTTGSGSVKYPTWSTVGLVNRNNSGTFMSRIILDANTSSAEVSAGSQTTTDDIIIGARRLTANTNTDLTQYYSGFVGAIAIWNYAMTDSQMHSAMGLLCPSEVLYTTFNGTNFGNGLVAYFPCNDPLGSTTITDCVQGLTGTCSTSSILNTSQYPHYPIICWGAAFINAFGSESGIGPQNQIVGGAGQGGIRQGRSVCSRGYSGQSVASIATNMPPGNTTSLEFMTWTYLILVGEHDFGNTTGVTNFLTNIISGLPHNRYVILGQVPNGVGTGSGPSSGAGTFDWGTNSRLQLDQLNTAMQHLVGNRFVNLQIPTVNLAILPSEANDQLQLRMPAHVVTSSGPPYPNDTGYIQWSLTVDLFLTALNPMW